MSNPPSRNVKVGRVSKTVVIKRKILFGDCDPEGIIYTPRFSYFAASKRSLFRIFYPNTWNYDLGTHTGADVINYVRAHTRATTPAIILTADTIVTAESVAALITVGSPLPFIINRWRETPCLRPSHRSWIRKTTKAEPLWKSRAASSSVQTTRMGRWNGCASAVIYSLLRDNSSWLVAVVWSDLGSSSTDYNSVVWTTFAKRHAKGF
jgi:hypothetical protein